MCFYFVDYPGLKTRKTIIISVVQVRWGFFCLPQIRLRYQWKYNNLDLK